MLRKHATFTISDSGIMVPGDITKKSASRLAAQLELPEDVTVLPGKLILSTRAISNRCNDNGDYFAADQLRGEFEGRTAHNDEYGYRTFIGVPSFLNHNNTSMDDPRGCVIASLMFEEPWTPQHDERVGRLAHTEHESTDSWVKVYHEIDADRYPLTAMAINLGLIKSTSMGTDIEYSECSICANRARYTNEYCSHIANSKMSRLFDVNGEQRLAYEKNYGEQFFEDSLLTVDPADPTADVLEILSERPKTACRELVRQAGESVSDWLDRRQEITRDAFRTQVAISHASKNHEAAPAKVARRHDIQSSTRRSELTARTNKPKILAGVQNGSYRLVIHASKPGFIWLEDRKANKTAFYGKANLNAQASNKSVKDRLQAGLRAEMKRSDFNKFAREIFASMRAKAEGEPEDGVQDHVDDIVDVKAEPSDHFDAVKPGGTVQDHVPADTAAEPADESDAINQANTVQDHVPQPYGDEANSKSDAVVDPDDDVVVARRKVEPVAQNQRKRAEDESGSGMPNSQPTNEQGGVTPDAEDKAESKENQMDIEARRRYVARMRAARRRRQADTGAGGLDLANPSDKGMNEADTLPAPQDEVATVDADDPDHGAPGGPTKTVDVNPTVEDEGVQKSVGLNRRQMALVNQKVAEQMEKMWAALELADHQARLGEIANSQVRVEARKIFNKESATDIKAQIKVYAKMQGGTREASRTTAATTRMTRPVMPKVAAAREDASINDVALASLAMG